MLFQALSVLAIALFVGFCHESASADKMIREMFNDKETVAQMVEAYLEYDVDAGMIFGLSAHMPELICYSDANEYDVQTYIQPYNCMGFLMQVEVEYIHKVIHAAKKPVMTIKSMAAGRVTW